MKKVDDQSVAVPALLERARRLGPQLGGAADQLNASIETAEKELAALRLGVTASVFLYADEDGRSVERLAFEKYGEAWRLVIESGDAIHDEWTLSPLVSASRRTRREAVALLPDLLAALIAAAEAEILEVEKAAQEVDRFTSAVRAAHDKGGR